VDVQVETRIWKAKLDKTVLPIVVVAVALSLMACNRKKYEVIERTQKEVPNFQQAGTHIEVDYVLLHDGHKIYATCDVTTVDNLDPNARCGLRALRTYECALGADRIEKAQLPQGDLNCKDSDGHNVYLYVDKKE